MRASFTEYKCSLQARSFPPSPGRDAGSSGSVAWLILNCARRTSTFLSCAFREQEGNQATLPSSLGFFTSPITFPR